MRYSVYAVRLIDGKKHRHYIETTESLDEAKHSANCCTCGNADYAYIKEIGGTTVFSIRRPDYEAPATAVLRPGHYQPSSEDPKG